MAAHRYRGVPEFVEATCGDVVTTWYQNTAEHRAIFTEVNCDITEEALPTTGDDFAPLVKDGLLAAFPKIDHVTDVPLHDHLQGRRGFNPKQ